MATIRQNPYSFGNLTGAFSSLFKKPVLPLKQPKVFGQTSTSPLNASVQPSIPPQPDIPSFATPTPPMSSSIVAGPKRPMGPIMPATSIKPLVPQISQKPSAPITPPIAPSSPIIPRLPSGLTEEEALAIQAQPQTPQNAPGATQTPTVPTISPETQKAVDSANSAYEKSLQISPDELSTQSDLDKLIESTKKGYLDVQDQPIAMPFITGQLASIERRATALAEPLERKLARLQATRTASLESSKFALTRADTQLAAEKAQAEKLRTESITAGKPSEVSPGASLVKFNPVTGKYENQYTAPEKITKPASAQEYEYAKSNGYKGTYEQYQNEDANRKRSIVNVNTGQNPNRILSIDEAKKLGVPYGTTESQAISQVKTPGVSTEASELKQNALTSAKDLLTKFQSGNKFAVGGTSIFGTLPGTQSRDFQVQFNNLKSLLSLDNVKLLKGQGQVSDAERKLLSEASAKLELGQSESEFQTALQGIITALSGQGESQNQPQQFQLPNGTIVHLQGDGTYK